MRTLRLKLNVSPDNPRPEARTAFETLSAIHEDQAIFQINETPYVDDDSWGFRASYRSEAAFVQTTSPAVVERAMATVAPRSFNERIDC
ncbi:MAG: hypothetical protein ABEI99_00340 [Halobaculum sp.]